MIMTVLMLGGAMIGASVIAGLLTTYRLQQAGRARDSAMAIFAADAGLEEGLYQCFKTGVNCANDIVKNLPNGASYTVTFNLGGAPGESEIRSTGRAKTATRALRFFY